jgi:competence protein ComEA
VRRFFILMIFFALPPLQFCADAMAQSAPKPAATAKNRFPLLPAGAGRTVMVRVCSKCHTPERAALERHNLDGWNDLIGVMQTNGAEASDDEFDQIAAYLAKAFPPGKAPPKNLPKLQ